jgi:hypothetical protein
MQRDAAFRSDVSAVRRFGAIAEKGGDKCGLTWRSSPLTVQIPGDECLLNAPGSKSQLVRYRVFPFTLALVEFPVGSSHYFITGFYFPGETGNTNTNRRRYSFTCRAEGGVLYRSTDTLGNFYRPAFRGFSQDHDEFITAVTREDIRLAQRFPDNLRDRNNQLVAYPMPKSSFTGLRSSASSINTENSRS